MKFRRVALFVKDADRLSRSYLVAGFDINLFQFAIECKIGAVLDENALVIAGHHYNLLDNSVKHAEHFRIL